MSEITIQVASHLAVDALKKSLEKNAITGEAAANVIGYFCNYWNGNIAIFDSPTTPDDDLKLTSNGSMGTLVKVRDRLKSQSKLPTVGDVLTALEGVDEAVEVGLSFLPVEGGHRGPNALNVPFSIDKVEDGDGKVFGILLTEG